MIRLSELKLPLSALNSADASDAAVLAAEPDSQPNPRPNAHPISALTQLAAQALGIEAAQIAELSVFKRSFDARKADIAAVYIVDLVLHGSSPDAAQLTEQALLARHAQHPHIRPSPNMGYPLVAQAPAHLAERPVVVGFGPCGIFAALVLAQMGFKPIVLERGKPVRERTKDTWGLWRKHTLQPQSNVQFGEGGAGTFSDGKLWSQIRDPRFLGRKVMAELVKAGAPEEILVHAHPHIGTFKLVKVVENLRAQIIALGGEVRFSQQVVDVLLEPHAAGQQLRGLEVYDAVRAQRYVLPANHVVMALGHSARDTFTTLFERGVAMQAKPFSVGFRIEHPQSLIDRARWGRHAGNAVLGAADYKLVHHASNQRSVYSFCMCPGGTVVAATSEIGRVVTNGMSQYSRNERNANAGIVVGIEPSDYPHSVADFSQAFGEELGQRYGEQASARYLAQTKAQGQAQSPVHLPIHPLAGIVLQRKLESHAFVLGGSNYCAPAQRVGDFLGQRASTSLGAVLPSYRPGVLPTDLASSLPSYAIDAIREALPAFGKKIKGFDLPDAVLTGVETRTSSPVKIPRGDDGQSSNVRGLYPAGEGAGYAGGILSAAVDGIGMAEAVAKNMLTG